MAKYILPSRGFYKDGVFYNPGEAFDLPEGTQQRDALRVGDGAPVLAVAPTQETTMSETQTARVPKASDKQKD